MKNPSSVPSSKRRGHRVMQVAIFICVAIVGAAAVTAAVEWRGQEITKNGVLTVVNPARPAQPHVEIVLEERWRIGGDTDDEDEFFGVLTHITADEAGNVYLLDAQLHQVNIYTRDGEFVRAIGREGEGPGEFRRPSGMLLVPGGSVGVIQAMPGKIILLTPEGEPAGNFPTPDAKDGGVQFFIGGRRAVDQVVLGAMQFARRDDGAEIKLELIRVDQTGKQTARYYEQNDTRNRANPVIDEQTSGDNAMVWDVGFDGRVYASRDFEAYRLDVWLPDGSPDRFIEREYEPRRRSDEEMKRAEARLPVWMGRRGRGISVERKISRTDRDIMHIYPRDDGSLWVISSQGGLDAPDGAIATFDVFDENGHFVRQVTLKGEGDFPEDGLHFVGNRLYVVTGLMSARAAMAGTGREEDYEDEEELTPMTVICYDLELQLHGMNR